MHMRGQVGVAAPSLVTLADIRAAVPRIAFLARRTPLLGPYACGSGESGASDGASPVAPRLWLKCENLQRVGAFKIRGACNMIARLSPPERAAGVITYSSGNHGQAVALVARQFRIPATIVMPETAPPVKVRRVRGYGAEVIFAGTTSTERKARAEAEASARGLTMVPPFDHPWIIAGAGTVGLEILEQCPQATTIYVPMGGGGLISGVAAAVKQMRAGVRIVGVEPAGAAKMSTSLAAGHPVTLPATASIADGLLTVRPGDLTFAHVQAYVDDVVTLPEEAIAMAVRWIFREARLVAEPSGAAAVAAVLRGGLPEESTSVAVLSGGNVEARAFAGYIADDAPEP
jgi:threonine dehydratase